MFQLEKVNALFNCNLCKGVLVDPILLPCGETVCKAHTDEISNGKCVFCSEMHISPLNGFPSNKIVKNQLDLEVNKINLNLSQFKDYHKLLQDLNKNLNEIETIQKDPDNYIYEYFAELTRQVDLRREIMIRDINEYSDKLIQKIEKLRKECMANSKEATQITQDLSTIRAKLNELNSMFNSLEIDDKKLEEIMSKKKSNELKDLMEPVWKQCKYDLQGKKNYKFITEKIKLEFIFGTFSCFDIDNNIMKVNIVIVKIKT